MGTIREQVEGEGPAQPVRCPICGQDNLTTQWCRHVRWTFDQGGPVEFARYALETSPYTHARGFKVGDIPARWWDQHGEWLVDLVTTRFHAEDGYVLGHVSDLDLLARDVWKEFRPEPVRPSLART